MADSYADKGIAERSSDIRQSLLDVLEKSKSAESLVELRKVADLLDRFQLWTGNLGALHHAQKRMSLESRLADSQEVKDQICEHLDDMQEALQDLLSLLSKSQSELVVNTEHAEDPASTNAPGYDLTKETPSEYTSAAEEADSILRMIIECLKALFRIGILVRKATPRDRFERALQQSEYEFTAQFDINYVQERYPKLAHEDSDWLATRLGDANSKRRRFMNYVRDHRAKLQVEDTNTVMNAPTVRQSSSKATTFLAPANLSTSEFLDSSIEDDDDSASLVSASTAFDTETSLRLPSLADLGPYSEYFECPICFTLQSFRTEKAWKLHAYRDLKAYVCTSAAKDCEHKMFSDRDTWFDHELKQHRSLYACKLCGVQYKAVEFLEQHFSDEHGPHSEEEVRSLIEHGKLVPSQLKAQDCPFCDEWASILSRRRHRADGRAPPSIEQGDILVSLTHFKRHVATHQEQLAIFAMPRMVDDEDERSHGTADPNSEALSKSGSYSSSDDEGFGLTLASIDDGFNTTLNAMCDELLASSLSDTEAWVDQYMNIIEITSKHIELGSDSHKASDGPGFVGKGFSRVTAVRVLLRVCPSFAKLLKRRRELRAHDNDVGRFQHLPTNLPRVKVYKLVDNDWKDQGTGFCKASAKNTDTGQREVVITVVSEIEPDLLIIEETVLVDDDHLHKQQDTLIVWTDPKAQTDMAVSFEKPDGRSAIWGIIDGVQKDIDDEQSTSGAEGEILPSMLDATTAEGLEASEPTQEILVKIRYPDKDTVQNGLENDLENNSLWWGEVCVLRKAQFALQDSDQSDKKLPGEKEPIINLKRPVNKSELRAVQHIVTDHPDSKKIELPGTGNEADLRPQDTTDPGPERVTGIDPAEYFAEILPGPVTREQADEQPTLPRDAKQFIEVKSSQPGLRSSASHSRIENTRSTDTTQKCVHQGCGKTYTDAEEVCRYHPGPPVFHEGEKGWKCCKPRVLTFEDFMEIEPCTQGKHSTTDIVPPIDRDTVIPTLDTSLPLTDDGAAGEERGESAKALVDGKELEHDALLPERGVERTGKTGLRVIKAYQTQLMSEPVAEAYRAEPTLESSEAGPVARKENLKAIQAHIDARKRELKTMAMSPNDDFQHESFQAMLKDIMVARQRGMDAARVAGIEGGESSQVQQQEVFGPAVSFMTDWIESLAEGDIIVPPCDRCRRLRVRCVKQLTDCRGCTGKNTQCRWIIVSDDEIAALLKSLSPPTP